MIPPIALGALIVGVPAVLVAYLALRRQSRSIFLFALALILVGLMLGALGMLLSSLIRQLENFAGVMNFVIFPMFFASSALYPLWRVQESSPYLYWVCQANPLTHAVELIRFAFYQRVAWDSLALVAIFTSVFLAGAIIAYDPSKGMLTRKGG